MSTREELTLQAERCLRQGRVDDAIAHYRDLAHLEPVEWGVVKQLADLLERAGQREGAARQFARWADYLFAEGFHAKAAALYKKVLKLDDADEQALWQLGEVSIALKLRADARVAFQRIVDLRERRGDTAGAAMARERRDAVEAVGAVPPMPAAAPPPAYASPRPPHAVARVVDEPAAPAVEPPGRLLSPAADASPPPMWPERPDSGAGPNPDGAPAPPRTRLGDSAGDGLPEGQRVAPERRDPSIEESAPVVLDSGGGRSEGSAFDWANLLGREVAVAAHPASTPAVHELAVTVEPLVVVAPRQEPPGPEAAVAEPTGPEPVVAEPAVLEPTPREFVAPEPPAVVASAPTAFVAPVSDARPAEVPAITEAGPPRIGDLRAQPLFAADAPLQPSFSMPRAWLSEAPAPLPPDTPRRRAPEDDFFFMDDATPARWAPPPVRALATGAPAHPPAPVEPEGAAGESGPGSEPVEVGADDVVNIDEEVDLTQLLEELKQWDPELPEPLRKPMSEARAVVAAPAPSPIDPPGVDEVLEAAFADLQRQGDSRAVAEQQLAAGRVFLAAGLASEAARAFERASVEPRARFDAARALAELHRSRGQLREAVGWYEQAAEAPVPDAAVKRAVLYDLAESLEALGETDRAVGVLLDLLSHVEDYRDARARLDRLLRADAGG